MRIGIIAEEDNDLAVIREFTSALLKPRRIGFSGFVGHGCGKLRRKCGAWACNLVRRGCPWVMVVHDLDVYDEVALQRELNTAIQPARARASVVLIPRREIEAWLLYDANAIARAFRETRVPRVPGNPESLIDPKQHLGDLIWRTYRKNYFNTVHNATIARHIDLSRLSRSRSFAPHPLFVASIRAALL